MRHLEPAMIATLLLVLVTSAPLLALGAGTPSLQQVWTITCDNCDLGYAAVSNNGDRVVAAVRYQDPDTYTYYTQIYFRDSSGNSLGDFQIAGTPHSIGMSYDGKRAVVIVGSTLLIYDYNEDTGQYELVKSIDDVYYDFYGVALPREDYGYVFYLQQIGTTWYLHAHDISSGADVSVGTLSYPRMVVSDAYTSDGYYVAVIGTYSDGSEGLRVYRYTVSDGFIVVGEVNYGDPVILYQIDLSQHGRILALEYLNTSTNRDYLEVYEVSVGGLQRIGERLEVSGIGLTRVQTYDDGVTSFYIVAGSSGGDAVIALADTESGSLTQVTTVGTGGDSIVADISYYGSYVMAANQGYIGPGSFLVLYSIGSGESSSASPSRAYHGDLSEDGSTIVVVDLTGTVYYYSTGVIEDSPVPIPEPATLVGIVIVLAVALYLVGKRPQSR